MGKNQEQVKNQKKVENKEQVKNPEDAICKDPVEIDTSQISIPKLNSEIPKKENALKDAQEINDSVSKDTVHNNLMASIDNSSQTKKVSLQSDIKNEMLEERSLAEIRSHDEVTSD